jgi:hypothetical protein
MVDGGWWMMDGSNERRNITDNTDNTDNRGWMDGTNGWTSTRERKRKREQRQPW